MGSKEPAGDKPSGSSDADASSSSALGAGKLGYKHDVYKKEGAKGERAWGNRKPDPPSSDPAEAPKKKGPSKEFSLSSGIKLTEGGTHVLGPDTKSGKQDKSFVQGLRVKTSDTEALAASVNVTEGKGKVVLLKGGAAASVLHGEIDIVEAITEAIFGKPKPAQEVPPPPAVSMAPFAVRVGDLTTHGCPLLPGPASPNVYIGGMPAWRCGIDMALCPFPGAAPHGTGPTLSGEPTVLINGMPAARMGDFVVEPTGGPNVIVTGCTTVMVGTPAPPPPDPPAPPKPEPPWVVFGATAEGDMVRGEAKFDASAEWDAKKRKGKIEGALGGSVALFQAKVPLNIKVRVPGLGGYLGLGLTVEASALSLGAEAGGGVALNKDGKKFKTDWGAKVGAGLFGVGAKFSVDYGE